MNTRRFNQSSGQEPGSKSQVSVTDRSSLREDDFLRIIWHERKRAERTHKPCLLMLVEMETQFSGEGNGKALGKILNALTSATRETDVTGWYQDEAVVGVLFTEIMFEDGASIVTKVMTRVSEALRTRLSPLQFNQASVSFLLFPGEREAEIPAALEAQALYTSLAVSDESGRLVQR
jgi:hypothetical protein